MPAVAAALPAVFTAVKVATTIYSAISAVRALKEGDILGAVLAGVSAYAGFSSLNPGVGTAAGQGGTGVGTSLEGYTPSPNAPGPEAYGLSPSDAGIIQAADEVAYAGTQDALTAGVGNIMPTNSVTDPMTAGGGTDFADMGTGAIEEAATDFEDFSDIGGTGIESDALAGLDQAVIGEAPTLAEQSAGGFLGDIGGTLNQGVDALGRGFGVLTQNPELLKFGGQMLQGYNQQRQYEDYLDQLEDQRERVGYTPSGTKFRRTADGRYEPIY